MLNMISIFIGYIFQVTFPHTFSHKLNTSPHSQICNTTYVTNANIASQKSSQLIFTIYISSSHHHHPSQNQPRTNRVPMEQLTQSITSFHLHVSPLTYNSINIVIGDDSILAPSCIPTTIGHASAIKAKYWLSKSRLISNNLANLTIK
jgi:hypothetical protein